MSLHRQGPRTLALIAIFKFLKSAALIVVVIGLVHLRRPDTNEHFFHWLRALPIATGHAWVAHAIDWMFDMSANKILLVAGVAFGYALLYGIEGFGLWHNAHWAEYLTIISTSLFVPFELWEMHVHFTLLKLGTLIINIAIVAYLVHLLRAERTGARRS